MTGTITDEDKLFVKNTVQSIVKPAIAAAVMARDQAWSERVAVLRAQIAATTIPHKEALLQIINLCFEELEVKDD